MGKNKFINIPPGRLTFTGHKPEVGLAYLAAASQARTQEEADGILAVEKKLVGLNKRDLYLAAQEDEPVAPLIGGSKVKASTLKHLANYERERRKAHQTHWRWVVGLIVTTVVALISASICLY